jgi:hypothetical protein
MAKPLVLLAPPLTAAVAHAAALWTSERTSKERVPHTDSLGSRWLQPRAEKAELTGELVREECMHCHLNMNITYFTTASPQPLQVSRTSAAGTRARRDATGTTTRTARSGAAPPRWWPRT